MKFQVNPGQQIPQGGPDPVTGEYVRRMLQAGEIVDGPPAWIDEFKGRMTPLDDDGNPIAVNELAAMNVDLATAKAHERVSILEDMIARNPGMVGEALQPELAKAKQEAESARADLEERRAAAKGRPSPQRVKPTPVISEHQ